MGSLVAQGSLQQYPVPEAPQTPEVQSSSSVHIPTAIGLKQAPALHTKRLAQSAAELQEVRQPASAPQPKLPGHARPTFSGWQAPAPSQAI